MRSRFQQILSSEPAQNEILKVAGLLDDEPKFPAADFELRVATALSFAATLPDLDLECGRFCNIEFPFRPIVRIDPIAEAVFIRRGFVAQHNAVRCDVAREEREGTRLLLCDWLAFGCGPQRHGLEVHHCAAFERTAAYAKGERLGPGEIETADG